jgi:phenylacetate-coenzyme A ligase PaaK-like adenylate-forming protein
LNLSNINSSNFEKIALDVFRIQAQGSRIYKRYLEHIETDVSKVQKLTDIPFLPISFFKTHRIILGNKTEDVIFTSSGTTGLNTSKHYVADLSIYETSFEGSFKSIYGDIEGYCVLALLPSYLEREGSSLIYMSQKLIEKSKHPNSGFYLNNHKALKTILNSLEQKQQKVILIGVSYALLDLLEKYKFKLRHTIVIETGGMKGRRKEMIKDEFYTILKEGFGLNSIHSEYGMTELLSQAYSQNNGHFFSPSWMQVLIRDINDPFCFLSQGKTGGINIIDLANINSCSFIATQDLGKINNDRSFSVLGRFDNTDIRGCNLMIN